MGKKDKKKKPEIHIEGILSKLSRCKNLSNKGIERHINRLTKVGKSSLKNQWEGYLNDLLKKGLDELNESKDSNSMDSIYKNSNKDFKNLKVTLGTLYEDNKFYSAQLNNAKNKLREKLEDRREEIKSEYINECTEKVNKLIKEINNIHGVDDTKSVEEIDRIINEYSGIKEVEKTDYRNNEGKVKDSEFRKLKKLLQRAENIAKDIKKYDKGIYRELINKINKSIKSPNFYSIICTYNLKKEEKQFEETEEKKESLDLPEQIEISKSLNNEIFIGIGHHCFSLERICSYIPNVGYKDLKEENIEKALNIINPLLYCLAEKIYKDIRDKGFIKQNLSS
ncbi:MAG: hypothetical protein KKE93_03850 [Nanoarchaeota archaeon]|nr:hypothetical protein [Nanoarchaeota archaeon]